MANFKLLFFDNRGLTNLEVYADYQDNIILSIVGEKDIRPSNNAIISFNIDTAIKLSKELRKQIAEAKKNNNKVKQS